MNKRRWPRRLLIFAVVLLSYLALLAWMRWCPAVSGIVVDAETGAPIAGAEIVRVGEGPFVISLESHVHYETPEALAKTDSHGLFSVSPTLRGNLGVLSFVPYGWVNSIALNVYQTDYIPAEIHENVWGEYGNPSRYKPTWGGWAEATTEKAVFMRRHRLFRGYEYRIQLTRPKNEQDWIVKCRHTIFMHDRYVSPEVSEQWLFDDLTVYLERWPGGEKAGDYYVEAWSTATLGTCDLMREELSRGQITPAQLRIRCQRADKIILLSHRLKAIPEGMTRESFEKGLQFKEEALRCIRKMVLHDQDSGGVESQ